MSIGTNSVNTGNAPLDASLRNALGVAVTQFANSGAAYSGAPVIGLLENPVLREARVHAARVSAKAEVSAAGAALGVPANKIAEFLMRLDQIDTVTGLNAAAADLTREIVGIAGENSREITSQLFDDREEAMKRINAEHKALYASDAMYRAATDKITAEAHETLAELDAKQAPLDKLAAKLGITTELDGDVAAAREALEQAEKNGDAIAAREAQVKYLQLLAEQNKLREIKARETGHGAEADQFGGHDTSINDALAKSKADYHKQAEEFLKAYERRMVLEGRNRQEIDKETSELRQTFKRKEAEFSTEEQITKVTSELRENTVSLTEKIEQNNGNASLPAEAPTVTVATNTQDGAKAQAPGKFSVSEASPAEEPIAAFTPPGRANATTLNVRHI